MEKHLSQMTLEELKQIIEQRAGVPASLLKGETAEETVIQAKALLAYKREYDEERHKTPREQFAEWLGADDAARAEADTAMAEIEAATSSYPDVRDGGSAYTTDRRPADARSAAEQFTEWFNGQSSFDPFKNAGGWRNL